MYLHNTSFVLWASFEVGSEWDLIILNTLCFYIKQEQKTVGKVLAYKNMKGHNILKSQNEHSDFMDNAEENA